MITKRIHPHALSMQDGAPTRPATRRTAEQNAWPEGRRAAGNAACQRLAVRGSGYQRALASEPEGVQGRGRDPQASGTQS